MSKIIVAEDKCIACGTCYALYPELFKSGEDGKSQLVSSDYEKHNYTKQEIEKCCPSQAITVED